MSRRNNWAFQKVERILIQLGFSGGTMKDYGIRELGIHKETGEWCVRVPYDESTTIDIKIKGHLLDEGGPEEAPAPIEEIHEAYENN